MNLSIENISKSYNKKMALDNFSAELTEGVYGLLGPNGAGKSTLMNIITDNLSPDGGQVLFDGENTVKMDKCFRRILGYMPQQQGIYDDFSAQRYLWYMASLKGLKKTEAKAQIDHLLTLVNLSEHRHKKLGAFSGGMKQRVLIAQALLGDPKVLLMDEPTAGLDPAERIRIRNFISKLSADKILIIATHVVSDIEFIAKEVLFLKQGKLEGCNSPEDWLLQMDGKVREYVVEEDVLSGYQEKYKISNIRRLADGIAVRLVGDELPEGGTAVSPTLEDVYLTIHGGQPFLPG